jgi:hypothetical protein
MEKQLKNAFRYLQKQESEQRREYLENTHPNCEDCSAKSRPEMAAVPIRLKKRKLLY